MSKLKDAPAKNLNAKKNIATVLVLVKNVVFNANVMDVKMKRMI
jgi:hypothetical protein